MREILDNDALMLPRSGNTDFGVYAIETYSYANGKNEHDITVHLYGSHAMVECALKNSSKSLNDLVYEECASVRWCDLVRSDRSGATDNIYPVFAKLYAVTESPDGESILPVVFIRNAVVDSSVFNGRDAIIEEDNMRRGYPSQKKYFVLVNCSGKINSDEGVRKFVESWKKAD